MAEKKEVRYSVKANFFQLNLIGKFTLTCEYKLLVAALG